MTDDQTVASRRIADDFAAQIDEGILKPGTKLPSERTLVRTYGVARNTVQAAMRLLAEAGMVVAHHGKGVYVREPEPLIRLGSDRYSPKYRDSGLSPFLIECERAGKRGRFEVLSIDRAQPPHDVAELLHVDEDTRLGAAPRKRVLGRRRSRLSRHHLHPLDHRPGHRSPGGRGAAPVRHPWRA